MSMLRKVIARTALAAMVGVGALAVTASPASAHVVCDRYHCWHVYGPSYYGDPYYDGYYGPAYYGPGVTFGFGFGGGHYYHGGGYYGGYHGGYGGYHGGYGGYHGSGGYHGGGHH